MPENRLFASGWFSLNCFLLDDGIIDDSLLKFYASRTNPAGGISRNFCYGLPKKLHDTTNRFLMQWPGGMG